MTALVFDLELWNFSNQVTWPYRIWNEAVYMRKLLSLKNFSGVTLDECTDSNENQPLLFSRFVFAPLASCACPPIKIEASVFHAVIVRTRC
jgi:hypothetical protein